MSTAERKSPLRVATLQDARLRLREYQPVEIPFETGMIAAAVSVLLRDGDDGLETLFIHRAVRVGDRWSGQIAFPGGRRDPAGPDLLTTALRETREEIGVDLSGAERLGVLDDLYPRTPVLPPVVVRPFVFALTKRPATVLSSEVQDVFWLPLSALE